MSDRRVATTLEPGTVLKGKYVIEEKLGGGGMGQVFRAVQQPIGRAVALKLLHPKFVSDQEVEARFLREARAASQLSHPNTITIYDFGQTSDGLYFIAMELIDGQPMSDLLDREETLTLSRTGPLIIQVAQSLGEAHRKGIIHRDLKPDNAMVIPAKGGENERVKVVDFGIAKVVDNTVGLTQTGSVFGTPGYMAPEQARGNEVSPSADFYALTCLLYECLTGRLPYRGGSALETMMQHQTEPIPTLGEEFPDKLDAFLKRGMAKHPAQRIQTADDFIAEFMSCFVEGSEGPDPSDVSSGQLEATTGNPVAGSDERDVVTTQDGTPTRAFDTGTDESNSRETQTSGGLGPGIAAVEEDASGQVGEPIEEVTDSDLGPTVAGPDDMAFQTTAEDQREAKSSGGLGDASSRSSVEGSKPPDIPGTGPGGESDRGSRSGNADASRSGERAPDRGQASGAGTGSSEAVSADGGGSESSVLIVVAVVMLAGGVGVGTLLAGGDGGGDAEADSNEATAATDSVPEAELEVASEPEGATVEIDGDRVGTTPTTIEAPKEESVDMTLRREGFEPAQLDDVRPADQADDRVFAALERKTIEVAVRSPFDATEVEIAGQSYGQIPAGRERRFELEWPEGALTVVLDPPDYARYVDRTPESALEERIEVAPPRSSFVSSSGDQGSDAGSGSSESG